MLIGHQTTTALFPVPMTLRLERPATPNVYKPYMPFIVTTECVERDESMLPWWQQLWVRLAFASTCALAALGLAFAGVPVQAVLPATFAMFFSNPAIIRRFKLRWVVYFVASFGVSLGSRLGMPNLT